MCTYKRNAKRHALFFGCSQVFGEGVNNDQTLPQLFQNFTNGYQAYNYGFPGYGPNTILRLLQKRDIEQEVFQRKGIAFFVYPIGNHEYRVRLHSDSFRQYAGHPYYEKKKEKIIYRGTLRDVQWFMYFLIKIYNKIPIPETYRHPFPRYPTAKDEELIADILCEVRDEYKKKFPEGSFFVLIHPLPINKADKEKKEKVVNLLKKKGLKVIDLYDLNQSASNRYDYTISRLDGHANAKLNKIIAMALACENYSL
jgi:hypothetical protein